MNTGYKIYEVMERKVHTADSESTVSEVAKIMSENKVGSVIITTDDAPTKILTEQDIARKVVAEGKDPKTEKVGDVAGEELISVESTRDIYEAILLMGNSDIKHLPVIDEGKLLGIITSKDIIRLEPHLVEMLSFKSSLNKEEAKKLFKKL
ncbi:CBS domain-containing protein [Candidatus Woesearchaeota archaeon]|nr:CBS domain-containing protein [Candidatus Woesearchaeota archaeon]